MIIHEFENGHHRLRYENGKEGEWADYEEIARLDEYGAVTNHHSHKLPPVFRIVELKTTEEYKNHHYNLDSDDYWGSVKISYFHPITYILSLFRRTI